MCVHIVNFMCGCLEPVHVSVCASCEAVHVCVCVHLVLRDVRNQFGPVMLISHRVLSVTNLTQWPPMAPKGSQKDVSALDMIQKLRSKKLEDVKDEVHSPSPAAASGSHALAPAHADAELDGAENIAGKGDEAEAEEKAEAKEKAKAANKKDEGDKAEGERKGSKDESKTDEGSTDENTKDEARSKAKGKSQSTKQRGCIAHDVEKRSEVQ